MDRGQAAVHFLDFRFRGNDGLGMNPRLKPSRACLSGNDRLGAGPRRLQFVTSRSGFPALSRNKAGPLPLPRQTERLSSPLRQDPRAGLLSCRLPPQGGVVDGPGTGQPPNVP